MAYYTEDPIVNQSLSLADAPSTFGETLAAGFEQGFVTSITPLAVEAENLQIQAEGRRRYLRGAGLQIEEPETPLVSKADAEERIKAEQFEIDVPENGIREGALNLLMDRKRAERERQLILNNAPAGSAPAVLLAQFAAQMVDPINVASAFIPVVGEARYTAMLARAGTAAGRFGVRAGVGAVEGAVGAAMLEPAVYTLSRQLQDDYDLTDSLENVLFGAALGGGLRSVGGAIFDKFTAKKDLAPVLDDLEPDARAAIEPNLPKQMEVPEARMAPAVDEVQIKQMALDNLAPTLRKELEEIAGGKLPNVRDIRQEVASLDQRLAELPDTFKDRARAFQSEGMSKAQAEVAAREAIDAERADIAARRNSLEQVANADKPAQAKADIEALDRGEIPARFASRIEAEQARIAQGFQPTKMAREIIPFADKKDLFHKTFASEMNGRPVNPQAYLDLKSPDPVIRQRGIDAIKTAKPKLETDYAPSVMRAADQEAMAKLSDDALQAELAAYDEATLKEVADQTGYNLDKDPDMVAADRFARETQAYQDVYKANALCMLRN